MPAEEITAAQCRAARALVRWSQQKLALSTGLDVMTIRAFEAEKSRPQAATQVILRRIFDAAGVEFIPETATAGAGVRLRRPRPPKA